MAPIINPTIKGQNKKDENINPVYVLRGMPMPALFPPGLPPVYVVRCPRLPCPPDDEISVTNLKKDNTHLKAYKKRFEVHVDVMFFAPGQISVKEINNTWIVQAHHDEMLDDHGFVSRSFCRRFVVPEEVDVKLVQAKLSTDGVLTIGAPFKPHKKERKVPIMYVGPVKRVKIPVK